MHNVKKMNHVIEQFESRYLLAGVTMLIHGYEGNIDGWVEKASEDIQDRAGGTGASSIYVMKVRQSGDSVAVTDFFPDDGQSNFKSTSRAELIIKLDWEPVSGGAFSTGDIADAVGSYFLSSHGSIPALVELPLHFIGHSRGASLGVALAKTLGERGVWVDQLTSLDPHPVDGENDFFGVSFGDQKMRIYDTVYFADNYWRTDGNANDFDFDGEAVTGTYQGNLNNIVQTNFIGSAHGAVTAYYVGTIDTSTNDGGDHPVLSGWYGSTASKPGRSQTGFTFSRIGQNTRPASGVSSLVGGSAARVTNGAAGTQWSNVFDLRITSDTSITAGEVISTQVKLADRDSSSTVQIYYDNDRNPYNGATLGTSKSFSTTGLAVGKIGAPTNMLSEGSYYVAAKSVDGAGHVRWSYSLNQISVSAPTFAAISSGKLIFNGTGGNDKLFMFQTGSNIVTRLNGVDLSFSNNQVSSVEVYPGLGNDSLDASGMTRAFYANGGPGRDILVGGNGNDTLSGGAQSNTLNGWLGDDVLNGSAGNDSMLGAGGYDRLYTNGGNDTLDGGSNVDRFFGSDSDELFIGGKGNDKIYAEGGNDTLLGGADSDILNGGDGTDSADDDSNDIRVSIEVLL